MKTIFILIFVIACTHASRWTDVRFLEPETASINKLKNISPSSERIVGGNEAAVGQFPYQAALVLDGVGVCGSTLISETIVLTAGHCLKGFLTIEVCLGAVELYNFEEPGRVNIISRDFQYHELYDLATITYDIGFIRLPEPVIMSPTIQLIRLPSYSQAEGESFAGAPAVVSGWGVYNSSIAEVSPVLKYAEMVVIENAECATYYGAFVIEDQMVCANDVTGNFCSSDSGGPLTVTESDGVITQVGINSFRLLPCEVKTPAGFVRVSTFVDWLETNAGVSIRP